MCVCTAVVLCHPRCTWNTRALSMVLTRAAEFSKGSCPRCCGSDAPPRAKHGKTKMFRVVAGIHFVCVSQIHDRSPVESSQRGETVIFKSLLDIASCLFLIYFFETPRGVEKKGENAKRHGVEKIHLTWSCLFMG